MGSIGQAYGRRYGGAVERRQLEYFLAVVDHGSFTAAAGSLYVAQPTLSQAIQALERELGTELFFRLHRGARLTPAGAALTTPARQIVRDMSTARAAVQDVVGLTTGQLDLAVLPALTVHPLASIIGEFRQAAPGVRLFIKQPEQIKTVRELVRSGDCEIGVLDQRAQDNDELKMEVIARQELYAVLPPGTDVGHTRPLSWPDLIEQGLIAGVRGTLVRDLAEQWAAEKGRKLNVAIELDRRETSLHLVLVGAGVAVLPTPLAQTAQLLGANIRPLRQDLPRTISMCWRDGPPSPAAAAFRRLVRSHVARAERAEPPVNLTPRT